MTIIFHDTYCKHTYLHNASMLTLVRGKLAYMTPGQRIKTERELRNWTQQRLADEIAKITKQRISRVAIAQWEGGSSKSQKPENLFAAAQVLGLSPHWVLSGHGEKYQSHVGLEVKEEAREYSSASIPSLSTEQRAALALLAEIDDEARAAWLNIGTLLARRQPERRKEDIGHTPERRHQRWIPDYERAPGEIGVNRRRETK